MVHEVLVVFFTDRKKFVFLVVQGIFLVVRPQIKTFFYVRLPYRHIQELALGRGGVKSPPPLATPMLIAGVGLGLVVEPFANKR